MRNKLEYLGRNIYFEFEGNKREEIQVTVKRILVEQPHENQLVIARNSQNLATDQQQCVHANL
jgi:hypothetical protein